MTRAEARFYGQLYGQPRFTDHGGTGELMIDNTTFILLQPFATRAFQWLETHPEDVLEFEAFLKIAEKTNAAMFDIGAHVGAFAVLFCKSSEHNVFAFEPVSQSQELIRQTADLNHIQAERIEVIGKALGRHSGIIEMHLDQTTGFAQVLPTGGQFQTKLSMQVTTVDMMRTTINTRIGLLKIDVEGFEAEVLQGASKTLCGDRPVVLLEIHNACLAERGVSLKRMLGEVEGHGYSLMRLNGLKITAGAASRVFLQRSHLLAVPKEKHRFYERLLAT
jgi:FkbM family methyltransferase